MDTKKYLKVYIDGYLLNKEPQGSTTYIKELYKEVSLLNPDIEFYIGCFKDKRIEKEFTGLKNIHFISYKNKSRIYRMIFEIPELINKHQFDFAHFQYVIPVIKNKNCKYITTIHDVLFNDFPEYFSKIYRLKRNFLFRSSAVRSDYILTVSEYSKQEIIKHYKLKRDNIFITPNAVNKDFFQSYNKSTHKEYINNKYGFNDFILYVSRIEPRKNQDLLLRTYLDLELSKTDTHLVFIGKNSIDNNAFNRMLLSLNKYQSDKIHYIEEVSQKDLIHFYKASKCFIYPSLSDGFGSPPVEAGALKIPVLCSNTTAMKSFSFFNPYFCDPNNKITFKDSFIHFITNLDSVNTDEIQNEIKNQYSWEDSAKVLTSIFNKNFESTKN
jgi:glycosyltransferase involved in cell wall biosynthesis